LFGIGLPELAVIALVAVVVFGPDRLPEFARQAGRLVRQLRRLANSAQTQLREELGPEYADLKLTDLDPREAIRRHIREAMEDEDAADAAAQKRGEPPKPPVDVLQHGETPPYDVDAT